MMTRSRFSICAWCFVVILSARTAPAKANRPLIRTASIIKNIHMARPMPFDEVVSSGLLGLDQEEPEARKLVMRQALEYMEMRQGQWSNQRAARWRAQCGPRRSENPFCVLELRRRELSAPSSKASLSKKYLAIERELLDGNFDTEGTNAAEASSELKRAIRKLDADHRLGQVAMQVADHTGCVPSNLATAIAYKLEERFPAIEIIELTKRLYRKSAACGQGFAAAQASFRLGLVKIWQDQCDDVPDLMLKAEATPDASQYHARAKYWRYYCADRKGDQSAKSLAKASLIRDYPMSFQTLAATAGDDVLIDQVLKQPTPKVAWRSIVHPEINPLIRGTEALIRAKAPRLAAEMIEHTVTEIGTVEPEVRLSIAVLMNRIGSTLPKFKILSELFQDAPQMVNLKTLKLFFPLDYFEIVRGQVEKIDPLLILSLIRQESAFNKEARSIAGARGLMQVMPATARVISRVHPGRLFDPRTNIDVGTKYLLSQLKQYSGDVELTLAAYNAGFNRVDDWRKRYPTDNRLLFLDFIPFRETREYVAAILRNYFWYVKLYSQQETLANSGSKSENKTDLKALAIVNGNAGVAAGSLASAMATMPSPAAVPTAEMTPPATEN